MKNRFEILFSLTLLLAGCNNGSPGVGTGTGYVGPVKQGPEYIARTVQGAIAQLRSLIADLKSMSAFQQQVFLNPDSSVCASEVDAVCAELARFTGDSRAIPGNVILQNLDEIAKNYLPGEGNVESTGGSYRVTIAGTDLVFRLVDETLNAENTAGKGQEAVPLAVRPPEKVVYVSVPYLSRCDAPDAQGKPLEHSYCTLSVYVLAGVIFHELLHLISHAKDSDAFDANHVVGTIYFAITNIVTSLAQKPSAVRRPLPIPEAGDGQAQSAPGYLAPPEPPEGLPTLPPGFPVPPVLPAPP